MNGIRNPTWKLSILALVVLSLAASARAHEGHHHTAMGTVEAVDATKLDLETREGTRASFVLTAQTSYKRGESAVKREEIAVGDRAAVMYEVKDGKNVAIEVKLGVKKHEDHAGHEAHGERQSAFSRTLGGGLTGLLPAR